MRTNSSNRGHSAGTGHVAQWMAGAALALFVFVRITREFIEGDVSANDRAILLAVTAKRTSWLTTTALDVTALGSVTLVVWFSALALVVLLAMRDRPGALQILLASTGAGILTQVTKDVIERVRPTEAPQLITVSGFSYPSGHSLAVSALYLTLAIVASRHLRHSAAKIAVFLAVLSVIVLVGASRVYLGVHYMTDVASGILLGAAWALLLAGFFSRFVQRASP